MNNAIKQRWRGLSGETDANRDGLQDAGDGAEVLTKVETEEVGVSQSLVSRHLRLLRAARLLRQKRQGKNVLYDPPGCHLATMLTNMMEHVVEPDDAQSGK